jgi:hypothetical protein
VRIPNNFLQCVTFLGVTLTEGPSAGEFLCLGTAFLIVMEQDGQPFSYLVTARHVLDEAQRGGFKTLQARFNRKEGGVEVVPLSDDHRIRFTSAAVDLAVYEHSIDFNTFECSALQLKTFADNQTISMYNIGPGDELFTIGLFSLREGRRRNIPIVRSGIIAAMPNEFEPFANNGEPYHAYLAEMRSIGGLSGSPVFIFIDHRSRVVPQPNVISLHQPDWTIFCIGIIQGHWDLKRNTDDSVVLPGQTDDVRLGFSKGENLNTGIAMVTPSQYLLTLLNHEKLKERRRTAIRETNR